MDFTISKDLTIRGLTPEQRDILERHFSFENPAYVDAIQFNRSTYGVKRTIKLYKRDKGALILPRGGLYKAISLVGKPDKIIDETAVFEKRVIPSKITLRALQQPWVDNMLAHRQGLGVAPAAGGKTVMALQIISTLGLPTLWLTHRQDLVNQLKERAGFFIEAGHIGTIGGGVYDLGEIITVGMLQTLAKRDITELAKMFGLVIIDEAHITPALQAMAVVRQLSPRYLYGLTATPYREDRLEQLMFDTIGPTIALLEREDVVEAKGIIPANVIVRDTKVTFNSFTPPDFRDVINYLVEHAERNMQIVQDVVTEVALGNICIVLTSRVEHGKTLKELVEKYGIECEHLHSQLSKKVREAALKRFTTGKIPLIIATYQLLSTGFDHQPTNRIFFALPHKAKSLIEQSKGRIERSCPGKEDALVYDYVDRIKMLQRQFDHRCEQYQEHNLIITFPK